jgi:hypothetical protein
MQTTWNVHRDNQVLEHRLYDNTSWRSLVIETAQAASKSSTDEYERDDNIRRGLEVIETAVHAVNPDWSNRDEPKTPPYWHHRSSPRLAGKKHGEPYIMRLDVEEAAGIYLRLPFRVDGLDRLLTDMLMAAEMFSYADEVQPQLKQKLPPLLAWIWNNLKSLVVGLSVAGALLWLAPNSTAMQWVSGIIAGLTLLFAAYSLIVFPFYYPAVRAQRLKFAATVMSMIDAYSTLGGSPAAIPHVRKMVDRATDSGVVWPAPLMALLDDIGERRKAI